MSPTFFQGLKIRKFISKSQAQDLEKAAKVRQTWHKIQAQYGDRPTGAEIRQYMANESKPNSDKPVLSSSMDIKRGGTSSAFMSSRIQELEEELEALKVQLQLTQTPAIHPITQNYIASLREENEILRDKLALLERLFKQTETFRKKSA